MATNTSNLNLSKPAYTDPADIAVINDNMDKLDGAVNGVEDGLAIVANGNTHAAVAAGQFVYVRNHSSLAQGVYKATTAIAANGALSTSNLTADASGGLNALKADIDTLNSNTVPNRMTITLNNSRDFAMGVFTANSNLRLWIPHQINLSDGSNGTVSNVSLTYIEAYCNAHNVVLTSNISSLNNGSYSAYGIVLNMNGSFGDTGLPLNTPMICPIRGTITLG